MQTKRYIPSSTVRTLFGDEVKEACSHAPVYIIIDGKIHIVECVKYSNVLKEGSATYLIAGVSIGEVEDFEG